MLSVHRLVQLEFKFHLSESERQESFDAATLLLLKVFPARGTSRVIIEDPLAGERYIIQVLALIKNWKKERTSLRSSGNFCSLICNAAW
jgi:hypothetical protein